MPDQRIIWVAGDLVPHNEAQLNLLSPTCQYGLNVFEGIRCYMDNEGDKLLVFRLKEHLDRLFKSADMLMIKPKYSASEIQRAVMETISANGYKEDIAVRIFQPGE